MKRTEFGTWVKTRLRDVGSSQKKLADALSRTPSNVSKILAGEHRIDPWSVPVWARVLQVSEEELQRRSGLKPQESEAEEAGQPFRPAPSPARHPDTEERRYWQAEVMVALGSIASMPPMPPGAFAQMVQTETDLLFDAAEDDDTRRRLLDHAVDALHLYLRASAANGKS